MTTLSTEHKAMVRESARGLNGGAADSFETAVVSRLDAMISSGAIKNITTPNVMTAISQELGKGK